MMKKRQRRPLFLILENIALEMRLTILKENDIFSLRGERMAQCKKDEIRERIEIAAEALFSSNGYSKTTVEDIALRSKVPVGNIYRYYSSKRQIYDALISTVFIEDFRRLLKLKISGETEDSTFISFIMTNKKRFLLLFSDAKGTAYEHLAESIIDDMTKLVMEKYFEQADSILTGMVRNIYAGYIDIMKKTILTYEDEAIILDQMNHLNAYHANGMKGLITWKNR